MSDQGSVAVVGLGAMGMGAALSCIRAGLDIAKPFHSSYIRKMVLFFVAVLASSARGGARVAQHRACAVCRLIF